MFIYSCRESFSHDFFVMDRIDAVQQLNIQEQICSKNDIYQPVIFIAGIQADHTFAHLCYVAAHLTTILPNFQFQSICKNHAEWKRWLNEHCKAQNWSHENSPLIWRQFGVRSANAVYMGGATQFWKFIHEYYGIQSQLTQDELQALGQDFVQETEAGKERNISKASEENQCIAILGSDVSLCQTLTAELFLIEKLHRAKSMIVKLYDTSSSNTKLKLPGDLSDAVTKGLHTPIIVQTIETALINCTVLILLEEIPRMEEETTENWLKRNSGIMLELAADINKFAPAEMKVIFCSNGPSCFNAGVLAATAPKLDANNIVAVALSEGLENLRETLDSVGFPLTEIGHPPVWGFSAISHFVDFCNTVQRHEIYRPNNRATRPHKGTTLPLGVKQPDSRSMFYLLHEKKSSLANNPTFEATKANDFQKSRAICDLLRLWYSDSSNTDGEIISLGVLSNGTFGIPSGIYFVQPVCLGKRKNKSHVWVPHTHFPVPNHTRLILRSMINEAKILLDKLGLQPIENAK